MDGLISDAGRQVAEAVAEQGLFDASTLKEPYRIEGKKTMGLEIAEQLGWTLPDVILYPTGGGSVSSASTRRCGSCRSWAGSRGRCRDWWRCRRAAAPPSSRPGSRGARIALLARFPDPGLWHQRAQGAGDFLVLDALYRTEGCAVAVDDSAIQREIRQLAAREGSFVCPEGRPPSPPPASCGKRAGYGGERVVVLNTGAGIKYPDAITVLPQRLRRDGRIPA